MADTTTLCGRARSCLSRCNLLTAAIAVALCSASYGYSIWHNSHLFGAADSSIIASTTVLVGATFCGSDARFDAASELDFATRHSAEEAGLSVSAPANSSRRALRACPPGRPARRCLVAPPPGYRRPLPWPASRDAVWAANVAHGAGSAGGGNWTRLDGDELRFTDAGPVAAYVDAVGELVPAAVRTALDVGAMHSGSWSASMLSRGVLAMSVAPTPGARAELALERGIPAMLAPLVLGRRLPYPARAFDIAHCGHCLVPRRLHDGLFLVEIDRVLRPGGYWVLSGAAAAANWSQEQVVVERVATSLCWTKVGEKGGVAVWRKPINHVGCKAGENVTRSPQFCTGENLDVAWNDKMGACIVPLPEVTEPGEVAGGELQKWPERLTSAPPTITRGALHAVTAETFSQDTEAWRKKVGYYRAMLVSQLGQEGSKYRNLLDMNAALGGFAAALVDDPVWVMNVVPPPAGADTLPVIYERGLIGTYHDWCEAMPTHPRTYDLLHADSLFTFYRDRCEMEDILLEMDRILRPNGTAIIRDDLGTLMKIKRIADGMRWDGQIADDEDGPGGRGKLLVAVKTSWTAQDQDQQQ